MFCCQVDNNTELRLFQATDASALHGLIEANRAYLRRWHPWVDLIQTQADAERFTAYWLLLNRENHALFAGIWFNHRFCGMLNFLNLDCLNRWAVLNYWLDESHQGQGIMTACCRALLNHAFHTLRLNRITIECATENARSRAIPERLGFQLEGVVRGVEWLHDHFADHAIYGMLRVDYPSSLRATPSDRRQLVAEAAAVPA